MKLRSWNKKYKRFCYFDNGNYYFSASKDWQYTLNPVNFDWNNEEQGFMIAGIFIYKNDVVEITTGFASYKKTIKGIIIINDNIPVFRTIDGFEYLLNILCDCCFKVVGNIHENKELMDE